MANQNHKSGSWNPGPHNTATPGVNDATLDARAVAFQQRAADIMIAKTIAKARGTSVRLVDVRRLEDGTLSVTTMDGATTIVDRATVEAKRAAETSPEKLASARRFLQARDAGRRSVRLARRLGRDRAEVPFFYFDETGTHRVGTTTVAVAPRIVPRKTVRRGRAARQATNARTRGSRRNRSSSSAASADDGSDPSDDPGEPAGPQIGGAR